MMYSLFSGIYGFRIITPAGGPYSDMGTEYGHVP